MTPARLLIVYNAEAGIVAGVKDSLHKLLKPETYPCRLCALTHESVRMDPAWKRFMDSVPIEVDTYHRPDFRARYPDLDVLLPAVMLERGDSVTLLVGAVELKGLRSVDALIDRVEQTLA